MIEMLARVVPAITNPFSLIAFVVFVAFFSVVKLMFASEIFKPLTKTQGFAVLNKILNIAAIIVVLVVVLGFIAYLFTVKSSDETTERVVERLTGVELAQREKTSSALEDEIRRIGTGILAGQLGGARLEGMPLREPIHQLALLLGPKDAYERVTALSAELDLPNVTPAFMPFSSDRELERTIYSPFGFVPSGYPPSDPGRFSSFHRFKLHSLEDSGREALAFLLKVDDEFLHKDLILFAGGRVSELMDTYPDSRFRDAVPYVMARQSLLEGQYSAAIDLARRFVSEYPDHRHADDALTIATIAAQLGGRGDEAFRLALEGVETPDGDMQWWFKNEFRNIGEASLTAHQIDAVLTEYGDRLPQIRENLTDQLLASRAYKSAVNGNLSEAIRQYQALAERAPHSVRREEMDKIAAWSHLQELARDTSPAGYYRLGLYLYDNELLFVNYIVYPSYNRASDSYFEKRNSYYLASRAFQKVVGATGAPSELKQKALYKLARCHQHLAYRAAFYDVRIGGRERADYRKLFQDDFWRCYSSYKSDDLADDCLAEVAWWARHYDDESRALQLFDQVLTEYPDSNAADNALYWMARIYERSNIPKALEMYSRLAAATPVSRWPDIARAALVRLRDEGARGSQASVRRQSLDAPSVRS